MLNYILIGVIVVLVIGALMFGLDKLFEAFKNILPRLVIGGVFRLYSFAIIASLIPEPDTNFVPSV